MIELMFAFVQVNLMDGLDLYQFHFLDQTNNPYKEYVGWSVVKEHPNNKKDIYLIEDHMDTIDKFLDNCNHEVYHIRLGYMGKNTIDTHHSIMKFRGIPRFKVCQELLGRLN